MTLVSLSMRHVCKHFSSLFFLIFEHWKGMIVDVFQPLILRLLFYLCSFNDRILVINCLSPSMQHTLLNRTIFLLKIYLFLLYRSLVKFFAPLDFFIVFLQIRINSFILSWSLSHAMFLYSLLILFHFCYACLNFW